MFLLGVCMQAGGGLYLGLSEYRLHVAFMFASFGEMEIGGGGGGDQGRWQPYPLAMALETGSQLALLTDGRPWLRRASPLLQLRFLSSSSAAFAGAHLALAKRAPSFSFHFGNSFLFPIPSLYRGIPGCGASSWNRCKPEHRMVLKLYRLLC